VAEDVWGVGGSTQDHIEEYALELLQAIRQHHPNNVILARKSPVGTPNTYALRKLTRAKPIPPALLPEGPGEGRYSTGYA
jgi:hypothetical protein